jgi:NADH-quinone oxidoreductase subunit A
MAFFGVIPKEVLYYEDLVKVFYVADDLLRENFYLFILYVFLSFLISTVVLFLPKLFVVELDSRQKLASYECGFEPFGQARVNFNVQFFVLGVLFILFDVEVFFILSWSVVLKFLPIQSFIAMYIFLIILMIGFIYEWKLGLLDWK